MSASSEDVLLKRFVSAGDAGAFSQIVHAHAGLVYGVCLRILGDKERAADATQETFFQLLRGAGQIKASVPAWLHRVATRKAVDMIRSDSSRQRTEAEYADRKVREIDTWQDLAPHVDQALNALAEEARDLLVEYYFENRSMADIAAEKGVSHPTVSRRIEAGRVQLREAFRKKGIVVAAAALGSLLTENAAQAAPAAVVAELAKIALLGANSASASASLSIAAAPSASGETASAFVATAKTKLIVAVVVGAIAVTGTIIYKHSATKPGPSELQDDNPRTTVRQSSEIARSNPVTPVSVPEESPAEELVEPVAQDSPQSRDSQLAPVSSEPMGAAIGAVFSEPSSSASEETVDEQPKYEFDLSTPQAAVQTFVRMFSSGDYESVMACVLPDGTDYEDIQETVNAGPDDSDYEVKLLFQSLDPEAEMPVRIKDQTPQRTSVAWFVTFKSDFIIEGHLFPAGSQMELDSTLVEQDGKWLIENF